MSDNAKDGASGTSTATAKNRVLAVKDYGEQERYKLYKSKIYSWNRVAFLSALIPYFAPLLLAILFSTEFNFLDLFIHGEMCLSALALSLTFSLEILGSPVILGVKG